MFCACAVVWLCVSRCFFFFSYLTFAKIIYAFVGINLPDGFLLLLLFAANIKVLTHTLPNIIWIYTVHVQCICAHTVRKWKSLHIKRQFNISIFRVHFLEELSHLFVYAARIPLFGPCNLNNVLHLTKRRRYIGYTVYTDVHLGVWACLLLFGYGCEYFGLATIFRR